MSPNEFDRSLMEDLSQLPPAPGEVGNYTPWRSAMTKILWGMGLTTFRFEFFYLQYILPLLGAALLYLGYRSLRRENRWFRLCWVLSGVLLAVHMATDILTATPVMGWIIQNSALQWGLTWLLQGMNLLMLFSLWQGTRAAFAVVGEKQPKDWLAQGFVCYLLALALALWSELVPASEAGLIGITITNDWLYYGRPILFIALEIRLLWCIAQQSAALADRGYAITPVPVRFTPTVFLAGAFAVVLLSLPIALWVSGRIPTGPAEPVPQLTAEQTAVRDRLVSLGLPEDIAAALDASELEHCAQAVAVKPSPFWDYRTGDTVTDTPRPMLPLADGTVELSSWVVFLSNGQIRQIHWFCYWEPPSIRLQEQFAVNNSGYFPIHDFNARLLWEQDGQTLTAAPTVQLSGGESEEEVKENLSSYLSAEAKLIEVEKLGHLRYYPWFTFSIPLESTQLRGYLSYTADVNEDMHPAPSDPAISDPENWSYYDLSIPVLRHQSRWFCYPFFSIARFGDAKSTAVYGPFAAAYVYFEYF